MAQVYALSVGDNSDSLSEFKKELEKDHKDNLIYAMDEAIRMLQLHGFQINTKWKRESLKKLDTELFELRQKNIRLLLYYDGEDFFIILHCFLKTTQQTPKKEIERAKKEIKRWKETKQD